MRLPKITVVTPCFNSERFIVETIRSVIDQGYPDLEYFIVDGGSTDNTVKIIQKYEKSITWWVSEPDQGMYDALNKGFSRSTGEIMLWINSDDFLFPKSLFSIAKVFNDLPEINWIHGLKVTIDKDGVVLNVRKPRNFSYFSLFMNDYKWIQQESVAWRRNLFLKSGNQLSSQYRYAGDFELWTRFLKIESPCNVPILIGGFRNRSGQLSKELDSLSNSYYDQEVNKIISHLEKPKKLSKIINRNNIYLRLINNLPSKWKSVLAKKQFSLLGFQKEAEFKDGFFCVK